MDSYGNEVRMSVNFSSIRVYGLAIAMSLGALLAGCGQSSDPGAERSQQQSEQLRDRINTTQIDR